MVNDPYHKLRELKQLADQGLLTPAEFQEHRQNILQNTSSLFDDETLGDRLAADRAHREPADGPRWPGQRILLGVGAVLVLVAAGALAQSLLPGWGPNESENNLENTTVVPDMAADGVDDRGASERASMQGQGTGSEAEKAELGGLGELADLLQEAVAHLEQARLSLNAAEGEADRAARSEEYRFAVDEVDQYVADIEEAAADVVLEEEDYAQLDDLIRAARDAARPITTEPVPDAIFAGLEAWEEQLRQQTQIKSGPSYADLEGRGYTLMDVSATALLDANDETYVNIRLASGGDYIIMGVCDNDCTDLDLALMRGSMLLSQDITQDDWPLVEYAGDGGSLQVKVRMYACSTADCGYQLTVWGK